MHLLFDAVKHISGEIQLGRACIQVMNMHKTEPENRFCFF